MDRKVVMAQFEAFCKADQNEPLDDNKIDPAEEQDWMSLSLGFFIALGATSAEAHDMALEARYTHKYWC